MKPFEKKYTGKTTEAELRALAAEGLNTWQIAERLSVSRSMVRTAVCLLGIPTVPGKRKPQVAVKPAIAPKPVSNVRPSADALRVARPFG